MFPRTPAGQPSPIATPSGGPYTACSRNSGDCRNEVNSFGTLSRRSESAHEQADVAGRAADGEPAAGRVRRGGGGGRGGGVFVPGAGPVGPPRPPPLRGGGA